jgi:hypothetical protein
MSYAHEIVVDYFRRRNVPPDSHLDGLYQYELTILRDMLDRLEVILDDEGVPRETGVRVVRCMLYGSPSPAAAEERIRREAEVVKLLSEQPPIPFVMPADLAAKLGVAPESQ